MFQLEQMDVVSIEIFYLGLIWFIYRKLKNTTIDLARLAPMGEIRRCVTLMIWLMFFVVIVFVSGGVLAHQDTAWHQVSLNVGGEMPARLIIYAIFYPAYLIMGGAIWMYAKTRIREDVFNKKFKIALICITLTPFMFLPGQDTEMMTWSSDWWNITYRSLYGLMNLVWVSSLLYLVYKLVSKVAVLSRQVGIR